MISKLPRWVRWGGGVLAFSAGMVNVIAILGFTHEAATHMTGIVSLFSISVFAGEAARIWRISLIILSFFFGATMAGIIVRDGQLRLGRRYGVALAAESLLLFVAAYGFVRQSLAAEYFASMAAGLQNAMASTYSGAIVRTTHLTGVLTDLGTLLGHKIRGVPVDRRQVTILAIIFFAFVAGGFLGAVLYRFYGPASMTVPACVIGASAVGYECFRRSVMAAKS